MSVSMLFLGDSLTTGLFSSAVETSYRYLLEQWFSATADSIPGVSGGSSHDFLTQQTAITAAAAAADFVVVELGTNDCAHAGVTEADLAANLRTLVGWCRDGNPNCGVVMLSTWHPTGAFPTWENTISNVADDYGGHYVSLQAIEDNAANRGPAGLATLWPGISDGHGGYITDNWHPNDAGHLAIATAVSAEIIAAGFANTPTAARTTCVFDGLNLNGDDTNYCTAPSFELDNRTVDPATQWFTDASSVTGSITKTRVAGSVGPYAYRIQYTGVVGDSPNKNLLIDQAYTAVGSYAPGGRATFDAILSGVATGAALSLQIIARSAAGGYLSLVAQSITLTATPTPVRVTYASLPANTSFIQVRISSTDVGSGDVLDITIDSGGLSDDWQDGHTTVTPPAFLRPAALGSGAYAQRFVYTGVVGDAASYVSIIHPTPGGFGPGDPFTVSLLLEGALAGCTCALEVSNQAWLNAASLAIVPTGLANRYQVSGVCPVGTTSLNAVVKVLGIDAGDTGDITVDDVLISKSAGDYFAGNYPGCRWTGPAHASASVRAQVYSIMPGIELGARQKTWNERKSYTGAVAQYNVSEAASIPMKFPLLVKGTSLADLDAKIQTINAKIDGCSSDSPKDLVYAGTTYQIVTTPRVAYVLDAAAVVLFWATFDLALNRLP